MTVAIKHLSILWYFFLSKFFLILWRNFIDIIQHICGMNSELTILYSWINCYKFMHRIIHEILFLRPTGKYWFKYFSSVTILCAKHWHLFCIHIYYWLYSFPFQVSTRVECLAFLCQDPDDRECLNWMENIIQCMR